MRKSILLLTLLIVGLLLASNCFDWPKSDNPHNPQTRHAESLPSTRANVTRARNGWLFYPPDVSHITGPPFDHAPPLAAITHFNQQLQARGVQLIVLPIPVKPTIHPQFLWPDSPRPRSNPSFDAFTQKLRAAGVYVFDPTPNLAAAAQAGQSLYLAADTHWSPHAADLVARALAHHINTNFNLPQTLGIRYTRTPRDIDGIGDLAELARDSNPPAPQRVTIQAVSQPDGSPWSPARDAEILFLGDSFSTIFAFEQMGWGAAAGFVEQLAYHLGRPIDAIRRNDGGALTNRQMLAAELARGQDRLAGKKLLIWQFASRELSFGDWSPVNLALPTPPATSSTANNFILPPPGQTWRIQGTVAAVGQVPATVNVAYRDHIVAVHLKNVSIESPTRTSQQAVVYLRSLVDAKRTPAADLKPGDRIRLQIRDWRDVARKYELIRLSNLPDPRLQIQPACWGDWLE